MDFLYNLLSYLKVQHFGYCSMSHCFFITIYCGGMFCEEFTEIAKGSGSVGEEIGKCYKTAGE